MQPSDQTETRLLEIVDTIRTLTPAQRQRLLRRLRVSGLLDPDEVVADRDRLQVAPALGGNVNPPAVNPTEPQRALLEPATNTEAVVPTDSNPADYQSSVSGKVVVSAAGEEADLAAQQAMVPLPGQAPEQPIGIIFDGGSRGDPAQGYGSYAIRWPGMPQQIVRLRFGDSVTDSEAEYDTLIAALEATLQRLQDNSAAPNTAKLDIRGDSILVISQITGQEECELPPLQLRCDRVRFLLRRFGDWSITRYHPEQRAHQKDS
jgi:hypothetical protein